MVFNSDEGSGKEVSEISVEYNPQQFVYGGNNVQNQKKQKTGGGKSSVIFTAVISSVVTTLILSLIMMTIAPAALKKMGYISETNGSAEKYKEITIVSETADSPVGAVASKVKPSIVGVVTTYQVYGGFFFGSSQSSGEGSGIILSEDGYILTNYHVIQDALSSDGSGSIADGNTVKVVLPNDGGEYEATVTGFDSRTDLAVLKIEKDGLTAAEIGDSADAEVGDMVVAIGNPMGLDFMGSVTVGYISGLDRDSGSLNDINLIQTDAAINPGNSGGALVNMKGQIIGINSAKIASVSYEGIGFAIPSNDAMKVINDLIDYTYVRRPQIGIKTSSEYTAEIAEHYGKPTGVFVGEIIEGMPAAEAGIQKQDIIHEIDGKVIESYDAFRKILLDYNVGDEVELNVYRDSTGEWFKVKLVLAESTSAS